jgi:predicted transcriptional regulator
MNVEVLDKLDKLEIDKEVKNLNYQVSLKLREILYYNNIDVKTFAMILDVRKNKVIEYLSGNYNFSIRIISKFEDLLGQKIIKI